MMDATVSHVAIQFILVVAYIGMTFNDAHSSHCCNCAANAIRREIVLRKTNFGQVENVQGSSNQAFPQQFNTGIDDVDLQDGEQQEE